MDTIKIKMTHDEYNNVDYYATFLIVERLRDDDNCYNNEKIVDITPVTPDIDAYKNERTGQYSYYKIKTEADYDDDDDYNIHYVACKDIYDFTLHCYNSNFELFLDLNTPTADGEHVSFTITSDDCMFYTEEENLDALIDKIKECGTIDEYLLERILSGVAPYIQEWSERG